MASSSSRSLRLVWRAGPGRTENFRVLLLDQDGVLLRNISVKNTTAFVELNELQPGTLYTVTVVTEAASLRSSASTRAVTGRFTCSGCFLSTSWFQMFPPLPQLQPPSQT